MRTIFTFTCLLLGLQITSQNIAPQYGRIETRSRDTTVTICTQDGIPDMIFFRPPTYAFQTAVIITDDQGIILDENRPFRYDFEGGEPGICRAYGVTYIGLLKLKPGSHIDTIKINGTMIGVTKNYVKVKKVLTIAGDVKDIFGEEIIQLCLGDNYPDTVRVANTSPVDENYAYILTDEQGIVLDVKEDNVFSFDDASPGTCYIYGVSYSGNLTVELGTGISTISLSDQCFDLSPNPLKIIRQDAFEDQVFITSQSGDTVKTCAGDGEADQVILESQTGAFPNLTYVITDTDYTILDLSTHDTVDFENAGPGTSLIWAVGYFGHLLEFSEEILFETILASQCFAISENPITVIRANVEKSIITAGSQDSVSFCSGDGTPDILIFSSNQAISDHYIFLLVENGLITKTFTDTLDLETINADQAEVLGLSYSGSLQEIVGSSIANTILSDDCYLLSSNSIFIEQAKVSGGKIATNMGDPVEICLQSGEEIEIALTQENSGAGEYIYILTDNQSVIRGLSSGTVTVNDSMVWNSLTVTGMSYQGAFTLQVGDTLIPEMVQGCVAFSENQIIIQKHHIDGGVISASTGDSLSTCYNNPVSSHLLLNVTGEGDGSYQFLIVDEDLVIRLIEASDSIPIESLTPGISLIYAINFLNEIPFSVGDTLASNLVCAAISTNHIWIELIDLPSISVTSSERDTFYLCANAVKLDSITFNVIPQVSNHALILTNEAGHIIAISSDNTISLDTSGTSNLRVYGATFTGNFMLNTNDTLFQGPLSDECFEISDQFLPIYMGDPNLVDGGNIKSDLGETVEFCVSDGEEDFIALSHQSGASSLYTYVVTNEQGNIIVTTKDSLLNFEGASAGISKIYGLSHTNPIPNLLGRNVAELLPIGCYDFSDNFISVTRSSVAEFTISFEGGDALSVCVKPENPEFITVDYGENSGGKQALILVNDAGMILQILNSNSFLSTDLTVTQATAWGLNYAGELTVKVGDTLTGKPLSDLCYARSNNFLNLTASVIEGGQISTAGGLNEVTVCIGNSAPDSVFFVTTAKATQYAWIISNAEGRVDAITTKNFYDFNHSQATLQVVTGIAYEGDLIIKPGDTMIGMNLASGCFELSGNLILVNKEKIDGGTIQTQQGSNSVVVCSGDMLSDLVTFQINDNQIESEAFVITDAIDMILSIHSSPEIDFNEVPEGICLVYGLTFTGELLSPIGASITSANFATDCFSLTSNSVEVVKSLPNGSRVETLFGDTTLQLCVADDEDDRVFFSSNTVSLANYQYVITDTNNVILTIPNIPAFDFEGSGAGVCRIWGISYTGNLLIKVGEDLDEVVIGTDCYDLSKNYILVDKVTEGVLCEAPITIKDYSPFKVRIHPNPVPSRLEVNIESLWPDFSSDRSIQIKISSLLNARVIQKKTIRGNQNYREWLDVKDLEKGVYILTVQVDNFVKSIKFIKE